MKKSIFTTLAISFLALTLSHASEGELETINKIKPILYKSSTHNMREIRIPEDATNAVLIAAIEKQECKKVKSLMETKNPSEPNVYTFKESKVNWTVGHLVEYELDNSTKKITQLLAPYFVGKKLDNLSSVFKIAQKDEGFEKHLIEVLKSFLKQ